MPDTATRTTPTPAPTPDRAADEEPAAADKTEPSEQTYPVARRGDAPGRVVSPYPPYNTLDVEGLESGSLALDPTVGKIFRVP